MQGTTSRINQSEDGKRRQRQSRGMGKPASTAGNTKENEAVCAEVNHVQEKNAATLKGEEPLQAWERWTYGGMGSLAPLAVAGITVDLSAVFSNIETVVLAGWCARAVLLFIIGGFVCFLHRSETDHWRAFLIGMSAPALITTFMASDARPREIYNIGSVAAAHSDVPAVNASNHVVYAGLSLSSPEMRELCYDKETRAEQFVRGLLARQRLASPSKWIVIPEVFTSPRDAERLLQEIAEEPDVSDKLYALIDAALWHKLRTRDSYDAYGVVLYRTPDSRYIISPVANVPEEAIAELRPAIDAVSSVLRQKVGLDLRITSIAELAGLLGFQLHQLPKCG